MKVVIKTEGEADEVGLELIENKVCLNFILPNYHTPNIEIKVDQKELSKAIKAIGEK